MRSEFPSPPSGWDGRRFNLSYRPRDGETLENGGALQGAAHAVVAELESIWKQENLLRFDQDTRLIGVRVPFDGLDDWLGVRRALDRTAPIKEWQLEELTTREARIRVGFVGAPDQLDFALGQAGLRLIAPDGGALGSAPSGTRGGSVTTSAGGSVITDTSVLEEGSAPAGSQQANAPGRAADSYPWRIVPREGS